MDGLSQIHNIYPYTSLWLFLFNKASFNFEIKICFTKMSLDELHLFTCDMRVSQRYYITTPIHLNPEIQTYMPIIQTFVLVFEPRPYRLRSCGH